MDDLSFVMISGYLWADVMVHRHRYKIGLTISVSKGMVIRAVFGFVLFLDVMGTYGVLLRIPHSLLSVFSNEFHLPSLRGIELLHFHVLNIWLAPSERLFS